MTFSAIILAGGKSQRMGHDKAWLEIDGKPLLARQIELVRELGVEEIFISGRSGVDYSAFGCPVVPDEFLDAGPLAGIARGLNAISTSMLLVLAVDLPGMSEECLRRLAAGSSENCGAIPKFTSQIEPLAAFYPKTACAMAVAGLEGGTLAAKHFAGQCVQSGLARFIELDAQDARYFINWNSPSDFASVVGSIRDS